MLSLQCMFKLTKKTCSASDALATAAGLNALSSEACFGACVLPVPMVLTRLHMLHVCTLVLTLARACRFAEDCFHFILAR